MATSTANVRHSNHSGGIHLIFRDDLISDVVRLVVVYGANPLNLLRHQSD